MGPEASPSAAAQEGARGTVTTATGPGVVVQQATERAMEPEGAGAGYGATDHEVAVRTLAVQELTTTTAVGLAQAMAGSPQGVRDPGDIAGGQTTGDTSGPEPPWWAIGRETAALRTIRHCRLGSFLKWGDPNIDPKIL